MTEREACALLKARFEAAGFHIAENQPFAEAGVRFELDGWDAAARVGYEYVTEEAGDSWDVDDKVIAALDAARASGDLNVLVVDEKDAPDATALDAAAARFLGELVKVAAPAKKKPAAPAKKKPAAPAKKKPAAPAKKKPAPRKAKTKSK